MSKLISTVSIFCVLLLAATGAWAVEIEFVPVGDKGNAADADTGYGRVDYDYNIGKYDVTAGQYCDFLNAIATKSDPYGLYNTSMNVAVNDLGCNIVRAGSAGNYKYTVADDWARRPVNFVSWGDAARFCNWLQKAQPTGVEGTDTTETGVYTLNGAITDALLMQVVRNPNAQFFIPNLNEWYKAAYFDPNKTGPGQAGYWMFPTKSDAVPSNVLSDTGTNNANFHDDALHTYTIGDPYFRTEVGTFAASPSPYGTFDQGGNVEQWNETPVNLTSRGIGGGAFISWYGAMGKTSGISINPTEENFGSGFRVANSSVPEPCTIVMLLLSMMTGFLWRHRNK